MLRVQRDLQGRGRVPAAHGREAFRLHQEQERGFAILVRTMATYLGPQ